MRKSILLGALVVCSMAKADITVALDSVTPLGPNNFLWAYEASLSNDARLDSATEPDDYFTIYDFLGYIPGSVMAPAGWTATVSNTERDVPGTMPGAGGYPADDATIENLVFTWNGGIRTDPGSLGIFSARSNRPEQDGLSSYVGQSTNNTPANNGDPMGNIGTLPTPSGEAGVVPEPASLIMMGSGLVGLVVAARRRRK